MKHPQAILALRTDFLRDTLGLKQGVNHMSVDQLSECCTEALMLGCRNWLESCEDFRQVLPYVIFVRSNARTGQPEYFAYQRGKGIGEGRLLGNVSIGVGGHVDFADIVHQNNVLSLAATVGVSVGREIKEEIKFLGGVERDLDMFSAGMLIDDTNDVGKVHLGVLLVVTLPDAMDMECIEDELDSIGFLSAEELLSGAYPLENWTRIALEHFVAKSAEAKHGES